MFAITVTQINDAPEIVSTALDFVYLGEEYVYEIDVVDPDDDSFEFVLYNDLRFIKISLLDALIAEYNSLL